MLPGLFNCCSTDSTTSSSRELKAACICSNLKPHALDLDVVGVIELLQHEGVAAERGLCVCVRARARARD